MLTRTKSLSLAAVITASTLLIADNAQAQCSRGGRGGSPGQSTPSTGSFNPLASLAGSSNLYAQQQQMLAMRQQMMLRQQRLYAMQRQQSQHLAQSRYDQRQSIQATRLARAEANRAKRADRIATLKAKRDAERLGEESDAMLAQATSASRLVAASDPNSNR